MRIAGTALLLCAPLLAQESAFFKEETPKPWIPDWELTLRGDRTSVYGTTPLEIERLWARLRLRWLFEGEYWKAGIGFRSSLGTDGNRFNIERYDQQPSNGTQLDQAWAALVAQSPRAFGELRFGLQENPLISQESLWDPDLRLTGASLRLGLRGERLREFGLRATTGRVRTLPGGDVNLSAAELVLRLDTGAFSWMAHAGRWRVDFDPSGDRERPVPGQPAGSRQRLEADVAGGSVIWNTAFPVELRSILHRNPETREDGEEFQAWLGSRNRVYWPQFGYVWQRYERTGTLYPVAGDDWWFIRSARGPRWELALPLPGKWLLSATYLRHQLYGPGIKSERRFVTLRKRF